MRNERIVVSRQALLDEVGLPPVRRDQHRRRVHLQPATQARVGGEPRVLHTVRGAATLREGENPAAGQAEARGGHRRADLRDPLPVRRGDRGRGRAGIRAAFDDLRKPPPRTSSTIGPRPTEADRDDLVGAGVGDAEVRVLNPNGEVRYLVGAPAAGQPGEHLDVADYRVVSRELIGLSRRREQRPSGRCPTNRWARCSATCSTPSPDERRPHREPRAHLPGFGVLGGTLLAFLGGLFVAQRAMRPISGLRAPPARWRVLRPRHDAAQAAGQR